MGRDFRSVIEEHRALLEKNLILTDEFWRVLVTHNVFTEGLVADIRKNASKQETAARLVDLIVTRTESGFKKFCDVLEVTGHHFLSDSLREAEMFDVGSGGITLSIDEMLKQLPNLSRHVKTAEQKKSLQNYVHEKIQKEVVKKTWKGDITIKEKLIMARQTQISDLWQNEEEGKIRDRSNQELLEEFTQLKDYTDDLRREIKSLYRHIEDMTRKHREELSSQVNCNMANDQNLTKLNEKTEDAGAILLQINDALMEVMADDYKTQQARTVYQTLEDNFQEFIKVHRELLQIFERFKEERFYTSNLIAGISLEIDDSIRPHFKQYISQVDGKLEDLKERIATLDRENREKLTLIEKLEWFKKSLEEEEKGGDEGPQVSTEQLLYEKQREENQGAIREKDDQILTLQKKAKALKERIQELEQLVQRSGQNTQNYKEAATAAAERLKEERVKDEIDSVAEATRNANSETETQRKRPSPITKEMLLPIRDPIIPIKEFSVPVPVPTKEKTTHKIQFSARSEISTKTRTSISSGPLPKLQNTDTDLTAKGISLPKPVSPPQRRSLFSSSPELVKSINGGIIPKTSVSKRLAATKALRATKLNPKA